MSLGKIGRAIALLSVTAVVAAFGTVVPVAAYAEDPPAAAATPLPETVSADALPTAQIDSGVVWAIKVVGDIAYVGGEFSNARPPGAAPGTSLAPRGNLLAFNIKTGQLTSWAPVTNAKVQDIAASPDGTKLYVVGNFTQVDGQTRNRIAVFNLPSGALSTTVVPNINGVTQSVAATNSTVYVGGYFSAINNSARARIGAFNAANGALLPYRPIVDDGQVQSLAVNPEGTKVVISGNFTSIFGGQTDPGYGLAMTDGVSGASLPMPVNTEVRNAGPNSGVMSVKSDGINFYGTGWHYGAGGNMEGAFSARWSDGVMNWIEDCHGDTYDIAPMNGVAYMASHKHYCGNSGGFPQTDPWSFYHSTAVSQSVQGTNTPDIYGYPDHAGKPRPEILNWYPQTSVGTYTGKSQAVWTVEGTDQYLIYGGEFPKVNGAVQQGLVRYAVRSIAPNKQGPRFLLNQTSWAPSVVSFTKGSVRIGYQTVWDRDDLNLTYRLYRGTENAAGLVDERAISTPFWKPLQQKFTQDGLTPGATYRYRVTATDPSGNVLKSDWVSVTVAANDASPYVSAVFDNNATNYWRLGEADGTTGFDWMGNSDLTLNGTVTRAAAGAINGDADLATTFTDGFGATAGPIVAPNTFTLEAWINTTTTSGGKIIGFGGSATGTSGSYDRHLYMDNQGRIWFGVYPGGIRTLNTTTTYNDGQWHHIAATLGADGMRLYVDGKLQGQRADTTSGQAYSGYWRIGKDNLGSWTSRPGSDQFEGTIDDVAIYPAPLTTAQVQGHFQSSGRTPAVPAAPVDAYGKLIYNSAPAMYWRFDETSGAALGDASVQGITGRLSGTYLRNQAGALAGGIGRAVNFLSNGGNAYTDFSFPAPGAFTLETWFRTGTTQGGKLIGFGSSQTGASGSYDRHIYMQDNGQLVFGTWTGVANTVTSPSRYNDNLWHHVVGTQDASGLKLYVDGAAVGAHPEAGAQPYVGYWRVGGDSTWGSTSSNLRGLFDETAVYTRALSASDVAAHNSVGRGNALPNTVPTASFTVTQNGLAVSVDGSGSSDSDGSIASYAWDFGDGAVSTGATASHTYAAAGSYTVQLTVTDDDNAPGTTTQNVTVSAQPVGQLASDAFSRLVNNGWGSADQGGPWTVRGGSTRFSVADGAGRITLPASTALTAYADLDGVSSSSTRVDAVFSVDKLVESNYVAVVGRRVGANSYVGRLRLQADGGVRLQLLQDSGTAIGAALQVPGLTMVPGEKYVLAIEVTGTSPTTVKAKVWKQSDPEPDWQRTGTNTLAALQAPGAVSVFGYLPNTPNGPVVVSFDQITVRDPARP